MNSIKLLANKIDRAAFYKQVTVNTYARSQNRLRRLPHKDTTKIREPRRLEIIETS